MDAAALARKYRALLAVRRGESVSLRALSLEFPGALRELDELPLDELERRIGELESGGPLRAELVAVGRFHELVRARIGRRVGAGSKPSRAALVALAAELGLSPLATHQLVFPHAHVRRGFEP